MEKFVERMINEHKELIVRINKLETFICETAIESVCKEEFANLCLQLKAMKDYAEILEVRLGGQNIIVTNGEYFGHITSAIDSDNIFDLSSKKIKKCKSSRVNDCPNGERNKN